METICMKCQNLFPGKNTKKYVKMSSAEIFTQNAKREGLSTDSIEIHVYTYVRAMKAMTLLLYNIGK